MRLSVKIKLSPEEKRQIGVPTAPRPEIDIVAYDVKENKLYLIEVKSYLDSPGVRYNDVVTIQKKQSGRFKILTCSNYQKVIEKRLLEDWRIVGQIPLNIKFRYGLVAGKIHSKKKNTNAEEDLVEYFAKKDWLFWGPKAIKERMKKLVEKGYENNEATIVSKILLK